MPMKASEFLHAQREDLPILLCEEDVQRKIFVVTGASQGIGREAACHLVRLGAACVVLAVRSLLKGEEARSWIESVTGIRGVVEVWELDITNFSMVQRFANRCIDVLGYIHGLVQNAAVTSSEHALNKEGYEMTVAGNVFGTVLLAFLLLPRMTETAYRTQGTPHIVFLTTALAFTQKDAMELLATAQYPALDSFNCWKYLATDTAARYSVSNLFKILVLREFFKLMPHSETRVVMNMVNPGYCKTELAKNGPLYFRLQFKLGALLIGRSPEMGSRTILHALHAGPESDGHFLSDCKIKDYIVEDWVTSEAGQAVQKKVWDDFIERLERIYPGCASQKT
ncbi:short-chain dehydrogenase [Stachybotrys elegans]|uniref:Short-chain dehydrogenase n=1 Tax=Stachybotrys elegans TaxID=80388 RepID=A0A8K0SYV1_9HYPO|nr:short-chain dehydrogenase [Stachybotrys elegans]